MGEKNKQVHGGGVGRNPQPINGAVELVTCCRMSGRGRLES